MILDGPYKTSEMGDCNFCDKNRKYVYILEGTDSAICEQCIKEIPKELSLLKLKLNTD